MKADYSTLWIAKNIEQLLTLANLTLHLLTVLYYSSPLYQIPSLQMKNSLILVGILSSSLMASATCLGSLVINTPNTPNSISFSAFTAGSTWAAASPGAGQLNSNTWAYNEGTRTTSVASFGGNIAGGQGVSSGFVTPGGVYAFDVAPGVRTLGVQPTQPLFTEGAFTLRLQNQTGITLNSIAVDWNVWVLNDQNRSNDFLFYFSDDNVTYTQGPVATTSVVSPTTASASPAWLSTSRSHTISVLSIPNNGFYYIRWGGNDLSGGGIAARDEFGLAGIQITAVPEPTALLFVGSVVGLIGFRRRK